jgi:hypothetical protein
MAGELADIRKKLAETWASEDFVRIRGKLKKEVRGVWDAVDKEFTLRAQLSSKVKEKVAEAYKKCLLTKQDGTAANCLKKAAMDNKLDELMREMYYKKE